VKKFLIAVLVLIILGVSGYLLYRYYLGDALNPQPKVTKTTSGYDITQGNTKSSINEMDNVSSFNFGVSIYPGAQEIQGQTSGGQMKSGDKTMTTGLFTTQNSVDDVVNYYGKEFGVNAVIGQETIGTTVQKTITQKNSTNAPIVIVSSDGKTTNIQIISVN